MIIPAIYENGIIRPLSPVSLQDGQTIQIQVLTDPAAIELEKIRRNLVTAGILTSPDEVREENELISDTAW